MPELAPRLAVDLSGGLIRIVEGAPGAPMRSGTGGTPKGSLVDGRVVDVEAVGGALRMLVARSEVTTNRAMIAASDAVATFRVMALPKAARDADVETAVARELPMEAERMSIRWLDIPYDGDERRVYAVAWDRGLVRNITNAVRAAGLEPGAVDLKSACIARTAPEASCIVVDLSGEPAEMFLIDGSMPQAWSTFRVDVAAGGDAGPSLVGPLKSMLRYYKRRRDTNFDPASPVLISSEQPLSSSSLGMLQRAVGQPVTHLPMPPRVPTEIRHATFLTCLGLIMRRSE